MPSFDTIMENGRNASAKKINSWCLVTFQIAATLAQLSPLFQTAPQLHVHVFGVGLAGVPCRRLFIPIFRTSATMTQIITCHVINKQQRHYRTGWHERFKNRRLPHTLLLLSMGFAFDRGTQVKCFRSY